ncbi:uncharacterized protein TNIN_282011 [Trichonephila inaurata madagascariensis]|uniref:Proteasome assembly chaperone 1 n=1 Tax=Trichonephila inaurata madagascariensis TaxID=2747483 RepID=A0A8X7CMZ1_9ARAC|nr:uncharacterized protein TNIN_282011 [Trichonephila inaurata madagascariensis]
MATFFGEIGPLSSRAVDDEEIEDQPIYDVIINTRPECPDMKADCKLLIFSTDTIAQAFIDSHIIADQAPDTVKYFLEVRYISKQGKDESTMYTNDFKLKSNGVKVAHTLFIEPNLVLCALTPNMPDEIALEVCELILSKVNCEEALILTSRHVSHFKTDHPLISDDPFLKSLVTSKYAAEHNCSIPQLPAPNFISNFPAALLTLFEIKKKGALCVINFVHSESLDLVNVTNFRKIFNDDLIVNLVPSKKTMENLRVHGGIDVCDSNLYT